MLKKISAIVLSSTQIADEPLEISEMTKKSQNQFVKLLNKTKTNFKTA